MEDLLDRCTLCPRRCGANRSGGQRGFCGAGQTVRIARTMLHRWEEPCLVGAHGAGAVFFSHCTLRCIYCQNAAISHEGDGSDVTEEELARLFLSLARQGAATLDLVTPTHYTPQILRALSLARKNGLTLPVVWNTSGYETVENVRRIAGAADIFLPDLKYAAEESGRLYSAAPDYAAAAQAAVTAMVAAARGARAPPRSAGTPPREYCTRTLAVGEFRRSGSAQPDAAVYAALPRGRVPAPASAADDL